MIRRRALLAAVALPGAAQGALAASGRPAMPIIEVAAEHDSYAPQEPIILRLRIANDGAEPLDLPHPEQPTGLPVYHLTGPSWPEGRRFRGLPPEPLVTLGDQPLPPLRLRLAPGEAWEGRIPLRHDIQPALPGDYRLTATLNPKADSFEAPPRGFTVQAFAPRLAHLGHGLPPLGAGEGMGVLLQPSGRGGMLYSFQYEETRPGIRQIGAINPVPRLALPAGASDILATCRNGPIFAEMLSWVFWREGRTIAGLVDTGVQHRLSLGDDLGALVAPALKPVDAPAEVVFLAADRAGLGLARFAAEPVEAWRIRLALPAAAIAAAIAPPAAGGTRAVAWASPNAAGGLTLQALRYGAAGAPVLSAPAEAGPLRLMPQLRPGLHAGPEGDALFGLLVARPDGALALLEARFGTAAPAVTLRDLGRAPGPVGSGSVLYSPDREGRLARCDIAVLLQNGILLHAGPGAPLAPARPQGAVLAPPLLAPGKDAPYVLLSDPLRGPILEPL